MALLVLVFMLVALPVDAWADHVVLKNGDTLTGTVTVMSSTDVTIETELAGRVVIRRASIVALTSTRFSLDQPAPAPAAAWQGALNTGWDMSRGNAETATISTYGAATRLGPLDRLGLFGAYLFSNVGSGNDAVTTAKAVRGGARYDHDLTRATFAFGFAEAEHDPPQLLESRAVLGGGAGAHLRKTAMSQFNVFGGVSYAQDRYTEVTTTTTTTSPPSSSGGGAPVTPPGQGGTPPGLARRGGTPPAVVRTETSRRLGELLVGEDWNQQLSDGVSASQSFRFFPAFSNTDDYRLSFDLSLSAQLNGWLQWNVSVTDRYLNIPPAGGAVQNDLFVATGLGITFGSGGGGTYRGADGPPRRR
jgi:putative salt-induced outer membrane protein YdiY